MNNPAPREIHGNGFHIGPFRFDAPLALAPMAGVTDRPFRQLCRSLGAAMTVSEMVSSKPELRHTRKTRLRLDHQGEPEPVIVQIAGTDARTMADAARFNVDQGAQIIDINMGCPAKKVCRVEAGSALMKDERKVARILSAVVEAVNAPVTLKTRTGWSAYNKNAPQIARIAEDCGVQALTIHGRTRDQKYFGSAEYDTIQSIKQSLSIPLIANGDIDSPRKAKMVMDFTNADAIMIGRAAQTRPWIFRHIRYFIEHGEILAEPDPTTKKTWLIHHLERLYKFYGEYQGIRVARKHIIWQLDGYREFQSCRSEVLKAESPEHQVGQIIHFFEQLEHGRFDQVC
jgi:tRNA-dihydrouridine synthase B